MSGLILVIIIWAVVIVAGATVYWGPPSLGRRVLAVKKDHPDYAEIDRLERELKMGKYVKTQAEFDAEVEQAIHPPPPPKPEVERNPVTMPMFKDYDEYAAWMRTRYPGWHG